MRRRQKYSPAGNAVSPTKTEPHNSGNTITFQSDPGAYVLMVDNGGVPTKTCIVYVQVSILEKKQRDHLACFQSSQWDSLSSLRLSLNSACSLSASTGAALIFLIMRLRSFDPIALTMRTIGKLGVDRHAVTTTVISTSFIALRQSHFWCGNTEKREKSLS